MEIQHNAPNLSGAKPCPSCKAQVARDAVICVQCGYNFATRQKVAGNSWFAANQKLVVMAGSGLLIMVLGLAYLFWPEPDLPPPVISTPDPVAQPAPAPTAEPEATAEPAAAEPEAPAQPEAPPEPTPEEIAAQKAEEERLAREAEEARLAAERAAFEARKAQAERTLRQQLETREPMHTLGETVELRRKNGLVHKGELQRFSGTGNERVAVVTTSTGEIGVPLVALDGPSRRRMDADYREAYIAHMLSTRLPDAPKPEPAE
jgi:type IV secretory pathway VirB10-like protein